jgi:hypothetical protein
LDESKLESYDFLILFLNCMECATFEYEMLLFLIYRCVVVEDSAIGLAAAKVAGMKCIVTKSGYISIY